MAGHEGSTIIVGFNGLRVLRDALSSLCVPRRITHLEVRQAKAAAQYFWCSIDVVGRCLMRRCPFTPHSAIDCLVFLHARPSRIFPRAANVSRYVTATGWVGSKLKRSRLRPAQTSNLTQWLSTLRSRARGSSSTLPGNLISMPC